MADGTDWRWCYDCPQAAADEIDRLRAQLDAIWANCRVVFYPTEPMAYPIEHAPGAGKDNRAAIEAELAKADGK